MTDYKPISCELHSSLELWIMHRERLRLAWRTAGSDEFTIGVVMPIDVTTEDGAEYLYFVRSEDDSPMKIRLDYIVRVELMDKKKDS
ncbi:MAG: transcriptional antiterminator, Rof [Gammaproteobacteria bacterium]|nr:MAG: transcriptional antiterminator, Rof [Gammaproteobacteria bacterium]